MSDNQHNIRALIPAGTEFSHYRILSRIGSGGQADVYLAEHTKLKCKVALKFLGEQFLFDSEVKSRFANEAKLVAAINHPNVVTIHDVDEYQGRPFISMQYVDGKTVAEIIKKKPVSVADAINITIKICDGLQAAHEKGLVHRDIKPSNIMIDEKHHVKILDFGIAKDQHSAVKTKTGETFGTPNYMSPEQIQGKKIDQRSDLFSLGVVLYEMISGKQAFSGNYIAAITYSIINESPTPLSNLVEGLPSELEKIVNRLLEKDPEKRYQDAVQVRDDLNKIVSDENQPAPPINPGFFSRQWSLAAVSVIVLIALFAVWYQADKTLPPATSLIMLAVLPFENLGSPADEYFTDGITDAIIVHLASNPSLGVISRNSSKKYKNTQKSNHQIGEELGVDYLLRGTVYWEREPGNRVRITGSLIRVSDDVNVWTDSYDKDLTKIFDLQEEVAFAVASALNLALDTDTASKLLLSTTANLAAYDFYLRGNHYYYRSWERIDLETAGELYGKAIDLDSNLAEAYAMLSRVHSSIYWEYYDRSEERCQSAFDNANQAIELSIKSPKSYVALGYYYYHCLRDYDNALDQFRKGLAIDPNNSNLYSAVAAVQRRQGKIHESLEIQKKALLLDPRSHLKFFTIAVTLGILRRYDEADSYLQKTVDIAPDFSIAHVYRACLPILRAGDIAESERILTDALNLTNLGESRYYWWLLKMINVTPQMTHLIPNTDTVAYYLFNAQHNRLSGEPEQERVYADSARNNLTHKIEEARDDAWFHSSLGLAYAGLRQQDSAIAHSEIALDLLSTSDDYFDSPFLLFNFAEVLVIFGLHDEALEQLELIMSIPGFTSAAYLRIDPLWEPLRQYPRFKALIEDNETEL